MIQTQTVSRRSSITIQPFHCKKKCKTVLISDCPVKKRLAFLDLIVEDSPFSEIELQEEVDTFLIAVSVRAAQEKNFI